MLVLWLIVWLLKGTPALHEWNAWLVSCIICAVLTVFQGKHHFS